MRQSIVCTSFLFFVFSGRTLAQLDTATVIGAITDAQGGVLPGTTMTARNVLTGFTRAGVTDGVGRYRLAALQPGEYEFRAELSGFTTVTRQGQTVRRPA